jgi:hypothetical protein
MGRGPLYRWSFCGASCGRWADRSARALRSLLVQPFKDLLRKRAHQLRVEIILLKILRLNVNLTQKRE